MTSGELRQQLIERLTRAEVDAPHLDAKWLIAHVLELEPSTTFPDDASVTVEEVARLDALVAERERGVPLAYLLGEWEFFSLPLFVTPAVLVPRPETELLVEWGSALLRDHPAPRIADIGTGSGCIAIALAAELPRATIDAVDLSPDALAVAARNVSRHGLTERVQLFEGDLVAPIEKRAPYDLIVSNPPYISPGDPRLEANVAAHEPALALFDRDGSVDGLGFYRRLLLEAVPLVHATGALLFELPEDGAEGVAAFARSEGATVDVREDLAGIERALLVQKAPANRV